MVIVHLVPKEEEEVGEEVGKVGETGGDIAEKIDTKEEEIIPILIKEGRDPIRAVEKSMMKYIRAIQSHTEGR